MSTLLGALVVALLATTIGAARVANLTRVAVVNPLTIRNAYDPRDAIVIREEIPFVVPAGKILVATALGANGGGTSANLIFDGVTMCSAQQNIATASMVSLPVGLSAFAGQVVTVLHDGAAGRAWGYLVDA